ncbi:MAG TPA: lysylphosphatidylglycerol synthase transmembrane domain-containing protein [Candidatus Moranbacteria bacterium]|nr:lysylphosphatidylglycerol synthase transmembrane domain-containing protein [Candidatus Moranbacteria bacterium]
MNRKYLKIFFKIIVSLIFVYWVVVKTDWPEFLFYLKKIEIWQIGCYLFFLVVGMVICSYRWKILAEFKGIKLPLWEYFKLYLTGTFINNFMPSFVAGDAYKAYQIAGAEKRYAEATSSVLMDRITGLLGAMILALIFSLINIKTVMGNKWLLLANIGIVLSFFVDLVIAKLREISWLKNFVFKIIPQKITIFLRELYSYNNKTGAISRAVFISIWFSLIGIALLNYILFRGLGVEIGILDYLSVIFIISIVSALPITMNNIGLKEWAYITFFGFFGVSSGAAVAASIISRFLQMLVSFLAFPIYIKSKK